MNIPLSKIHPPFEHISSSVVFNYIETLFEALSCYIVLSCFRYGFYNAIFHSFGAGVMLCTCLIHLVTSVHSAISNEIEGDVAASSQYSQFLICSGFFMIYFLEELGQWIIAKVPAKPFVSNPEYSASVSIFQQNVMYASHII